MTEAELADNLLTEIEITPDEITEYKVRYHQDYLAKWLEGEGRDAIFLLFAFERQFI